MCTGSTRPRDAALEQRGMGPKEDTDATAQLSARGMTIREIDGRAFLPVAARLWESEARTLGAGSWLEAIRG